MLLDVDLAELVLCQGYNLECARRHCKAVSYVLWGLRYVALHSSIAHRYLVLLIQHIWERLGCAWQASYKVLRLREMLILELRWSHAGGHNLLLRLVDIWECETWCLLALLN